jgi:hypothetical protein
MVLSLVMVTDRVLINCKIILYIVLLLIATYHFTGFQIT